MKACFLLLKVVNRVFVYSARPVVFPVFFPVPGAFVAYMLFAHLFIKRSFPSRYFLIFV